MLYIIRKSETGTVLAKTHSFNKVIEMMNEVTKLHVDAVNDDHVEDPVIYDNFKKETIKVKEEIDLTADCLLGGFSVVCLIGLLDLIYYLMIVNN